MYWCKCPLVSIIVMSFRLSVGTLFDSLFTFNSMVSLAHIQRCHNVGHLMSSSFLPMSLVVCQSPIINQDGLIWTISSLSMLNDAWGSQTMLAYSMTGLTNVVKPFDFLGSGLWWFSTESCLFYWISWWLMIFINSKIAWCWFLSINIWLIWW